MSRGLASADVCEVGSGLGLLEGPLWLDRSLFFVAVSRGVVYRWDGAEFTITCEVGGGPNGLAADANGAIWIAQNGGTRGWRGATRPRPAGLQRLAGDCLEDVVVTGHDAPNDLVVGPGGRIYFTDPPLGHDHRPVPGRLCRFDPQTGVDEVLDEGIIFPNGIAFDPRLENLYVVETGARRILRYAYVNGRLGARELYAQLEHGEPDGICFDAEGRLYVANGPADDIAVIEPDAADVRYHPAPRFPTNCCFGGSSLETLFVTFASGGRLLAFASDVPGAALPSAPAR
ncbi:MAG TPA: SMP-30/gluconolactonase/LRE family protein [Gaiellaceae bacterium]|nr:SMP-30/gluconolactonase/LRE family protein [Gaiellaceae bacterium]